MNRLFSVLILSFTLVALPVVANAQKAAVIAPNSPQLFALEDIRPGMKGTARTVSVAPTLRSSV
jgi:hypothetical protein